MLAGWARYSFVEVVAEGNDVVIVVEELGDEGGWVACVGEEVDLSAGSGEGDVEETACLRYLMVR